MNIDMSKKLVVFDAGIPQLLENKVFDPVLAQQVSHTILPACYLYREALKRGIQLVTPDVFFALPQKPTYVPLVSNLTSPFTGMLIDAGVDPVILTCGESPFIATRFYVGLRRISKAFAHSFVFRGMRRQLSGDTQYHQMFFPEAFTITDFKTLPFAAKKFITMISGNKRIDNWKKNIVLKVMYGFGVTEIYDKRRAVIRYFADKGLDLYGFGWEKDVSPEVIATYKGSIEDKTHVLSQYKFAFCFENSIFEGYVTEKIFDVMFAGCVPVYCGAPDIVEYVPKEAFIDVRNFDTLHDLALFLEEMNEERYNDYIDTIKTFLHSDGYRRFSQEHYTAEVLDIIEESFKKHA